MTDSLAAGEFLANSLEHKVMSMSFAFQRPPSMEAIWLRMNKNLHHMLSNRRLAGMALTLRGH